MRLHTLLALALLTAALSAQTPTGHITGRVIDSTQAAIPAATVRAVNLDTNVAARAASNPEGNFELRNLIPGAYRVEAEKEGFKRFVQQRVELRVGDVLNLELRMDLGAVTDSITVTSEAPLLESANASVGQVIDNRRIMELPSPGGSVIYMMQMVPGVVTTTAPTNLWPPDALGSASGTSISGSGGSSSEFAMDGTPIMSRAGGFTLNPPPEMVQEFRVQTAAYDASVGRFTGAYINMVIKSGTNQLHGSAVFQNQSRGLMAHDFFTNRAIYDLSTGPVTSDKIDRAWPPQRVLRFRGSIGGPVLIPKLYDGRNRTFWTFGGDGVDRQRASRASYSVPSEKQRQGDFSELLALGTQYQVYDPATIAAAANGRFSRQPFAGNIVPASRIDPIAKKLIAYYPQSNTAGNRDGTSNYTDPNMADSPYKGFLGRIDHALSDTHRLFVSFNRAYTDPVSNYYFHNESTGTIRTRRQTGVTLDDSLVLRPDLILNVRYGVNRFIDQTAPPSIGFDLSALGLSQSLVKQLDGTLTTIPQTSITGLTGIGGTSGSIPATTYHNLSGQATYMRGNHSLKFGAEGRLMLENVTTFGNISPAYSFGTTWTQGPWDNSAGATVGQGLASLLLGCPTGGGVDRNASTAESSTYYGIFFQDDWKLTRKLTVNLGLRWDYDTPSVERFNRSTRGFDFAAASPVDAAARAAYAASPIAEIPASSFQVKGGLLFAGANGQPRGLYDSDRNNFNPRIGLAYQWRQRTVIRAGYGVYFIPLGSDRVDAGQQGYSRRTTLVPSLDNGLTFRATLADPFPDGILEPLGNSQGLATYLGQSVSFALPSRRTGYMQRWTFNIQHEFPHRVLLDVGYLGNKAVGLAVSNAYNAVPSQYLSTATYRDTNTINYYSQAVTNPFAGLPEFVGSSLQSKTVARSQLLRAYPQFTGVTASGSGGFSWYHALEARLERRFAQGYTIQASYTWSKFMEAVDKLNDSDTYPHRVISSLDRTHSLAISAIYEFPFGRGKRWLSGNRWLDYAVGGWSAQGIYQGASGRPLSWGNIFFYGDVRDIPIPNSERTVDRWFNVDAGFEKNSARQPSFNLRTFPLRLSGVRGDGVNICNLSMVKNFRLGERVGLQFRAEAVDAFNHAIFSDPSTTVTAGTFGKVTTLGSGNTQRRIILGGKLTW